MKKIRVLVNGAQGKMGQAVLKALEGQDDLVLVAACDRHDNLKTELKQSQAQVAVDFTHPDSAMENARTILEAGVSPVIGTTGFSQKNIEELQKLSQKKKVGGILAPNFSIGVILLNRFAAEAVRHFDSVEIIELHHNQKADAPSGTAEQTAKLLNAQAKRKLNASGIRSKESVTGARGGWIGEIPVHSVRLPGLLAHQEILFGGAGQLLTLRHDATSRETYMPGVLLAIRKAPALKSLIYGLESLLFPESS